MIADAHPPGRSGDALEVLLVEDDDGDALLVREMLADAQFAVSLRRTSTLTAALPEAERADCVLLDLALPDSFGLGGLARLREAAPHTPIVVLTGRQDELDGAAAVGAGAQDYLSKQQIDGPMLAKALRYSWERKRAGQAEQHLVEQRMLAQENQRLARGLLPAPLLTDPRLSLSTCYRPGSAGMLLGGDFYDLIELPDGRVLAMIGDVSGHGPDEAALGVALRIAWRSLVLGGIPVGDLLPVVDSILMRERIRMMFATLAMVEIEADRTALRLWLAGHPAPLLVSGTRAEPLPPTTRGVPLGLSLGPPAGWTPLRVPLPPDWALVLHTDGLFEGRTPAGDRLGEERMLCLLDDTLAARPDWRDDQEAMIETLVAEVERLHGGPLDDDVAVALIAYRAGAQA